MGIGNSREGFISKGRVVYSVLYTLECPPPEIKQLVVPLDRDGNSLTGLARAADPTRRIVQVHPGEKILYRNQLRTVTAVEAYRFVELNPTTTRPAYPTTCVLRP